ncbi:MAG TPA: thioredoxin family protein [Candidatus Butyricicoccus avicola]|nr:thioredoxin family protein [Candidatus Butyricicoccus avicola]
MLTLNRENFAQEVLQSEQPVLVEFWAPWCVYCRRISPALDRMDQASEVKIAKINIDEQPELAAQFQVEVIPTFLLFQQGQHGDRLIAPGSQAQIEEWIRTQRG